MNKKKLTELLAEESIVLLKNQEGLLPLSTEKTLAVFGRSALVTYVSGNGSGAAKGSRSSNITLELERAGYSLCQTLRAFYQSMRSSEPGNLHEEFDFSQGDAVGNSGLMYEIFGRYHGPEPEYDVPEKELRQAARETDTAVLVIGRNSGGEECDRHLQDDYLLTEKEKELADRVCRSFAHVALVLNVNGLVDLAWTRQYESLKSILFLGLPGEGGARALARLIKGEASPSAKLAFTIPVHYEDCPSADHFSWQKERDDRILTYEDYGLDPKENGSAGFARSPVTVYQEGMFNGYRYFDTFHREVLYPFGHGLSYTTFDIQVAGMRRQKEGVEFQIVVLNTGGFSGKEVVQLYVVPAKRKPGLPARELKGFEKTPLIKPGEKTLLTIRLPWKELAHYDEAAAAWKLYRGGCRVELATGGRGKYICQIEVMEDLLIEQCQAALSLKPCNEGRLDFLEKEQTENLQDNLDEKVPVFVLFPEDVQGIFKNSGTAADEGGIVDESGPAADGRTAANSRIAVDSRAVDGGRAIDVADFRDEELAALCVGYGPGIPFAAFSDTEFPKTVFDTEGQPLTENDHPAGYDGYVSPAIRKRGISSVFYQDGPAGVGKTVWPSQMLLACSFNRTLLYEFGNAVGAECEEKSIDVWLAPALNLHRNPLCGRNFEYFSEDPFLTGVCGCAVIRGVQENHKVMACPKHFAVNEQETYRRGNSKKQFDAVDSILLPGTARELYLKPFEMAVKEGGVSCIMTSFNKINGTFAGGNRDLCTQILRNEWGFRGFVVTDWGDMDIVVDGADAVAAGNDVVMPGGPPVIRQILDGLRQGRVTREQLECAAANLLGVIVRAG